MSATIKCERCRVLIPIENLDIPNRCTDWRCPTTSYEFRMLRARMLGMRADWLAKMDAKQVEALADRARALAELEAAE